jgi:hypothetical protein
LTYHMDSSALNDRLAQLAEKSGEDLARELSIEFTNLYRELAALKQEISALTRDRVSSGAPLENVTIEAHQALCSEDGFYGLEQTPAGAPFRWTGPIPEFRFNVLVDRAHGADLHLVALSSIDFEAQKDVTLTADGEPVPISVTADPPGLALTAFLPPREGRKVTSLVFSLPPVLAPPGGTDERLLGIAFARLSVTARPADVAGTDGSEKFAAE